MKLRKGSPGGGSGQRLESFCYTSVTHGLKGSFSAHLAGEPYWCEEAHEYHDRLGPTQPCVHWMTNGEVSCARCRKQPRAVCLAWVPLYRCEDGQPILVIVHETAADLMKGLHYPDHVVVGRVTAKSSVYVKATTEREKFTTSNELRKRPVCIDEQLLNLWKLPELNAWLQSQGAAIRAHKVNAAEVETESSGSVPLKTERLASYFDAEAEKLKEAEERARRNAEFIREKGANKSNGHHKKEGE